MAYIKWTFIVIIWALIASVLHYTLPGRDIIRITDTYVERIDFGDNSIFWAHAQTGDAGGTVSRDVFFIQAFGTNNRPRIYRNEDTGWGWPPYFKFDTSNLQAEASDLESKSTGGGEQWAMMTHYGWRNEFFSVYPNAISVRAVSGPDYSKGVNWVNAVILATLFGIFWAIWVRWRRFKEARVDPALESVGDSIDEGGNRLRRMFSGKS